MSKVFVLDTNKQPLNAIDPGRARILLKLGRAAVFRQYPFTIILKEVISNPVIQPLRLKIDPGAKTTGIALLDDSTGEVVFAANLEERGFLISKQLLKRNEQRRSRRNRKTRYRRPPGKHKKAVPKRLREGWLPPSLKSRLYNIETWVSRLRKLAPITAISQELVRFDTQALQNPTISGVEYQQGTLHGYEVREYLLEKWQRKCAYCTACEVALEIEHIVPKSKGGSNRVSNLTLSCHQCNQAKGNRAIKDFLSSNPSLLQSILSQAKKPLADTAAVNATRWALYSSLKSTGLPVEVGSGGLTKFNRCSRNLGKDHWIDAACVGKSTPSKILVNGIQPLLITAKGHGSRQFQNVDKRGFPKGKPRSRQRTFFGFKTGEIVKANVPKGKKAGVYVGRVLVRASGYFDISTPSGRVSGISHKSCRIVHRDDGYNYGHGASVTKVGEPNPSSYSSPKETRTETELEWIQLSL